MQIHIWFSVARVSHDDHEVQNDWFIDENSFYHSLAAPLLRMFILLRCLPLLLWHK